MKATLNQKSGSLGIVFLVVAKTCLDPYLHWIWGLAKDWKAVLSGRKNLSWLRMSLRSWEGKSSRARLEKATSITFLLNSQMQKACSLALTPLIARHIADS